MAELKVCGAHELNKGDLSLKPCNYCSGCGEWLCKECMGQPFTRGIAAARRAKQRLGALGSLLFPSKVA